MRGRPGVPRRAWPALVLLGVVACSTPSQTATPSPEGTTPASSSSPASTTSGTPAPTSTRTPDTTPPSPSPEHDPHARPDWLGTRTVTEGQREPTPPELRDRRLEPPPGGLPDPPDEAFRYEVGRVPDDVRQRATWEPGCPVGIGDLRYVTLTFWGFDEEVHTGELIVHAQVAEDVVQVFEGLYEARYPVEQMRVVSPAELDAPPTGDGNNTTAFVCRPVTGGSGWSQHAYGLAIDVNPFHNPYIRGDVVIPEFATAYLDRDRDLPGMIHDGDEVVRAFREIGWEWGGDWNTLKDWQHFSRGGG